MSIMIIVDAKLKEESISKAIEFFAGIVPDTRSFEGCGGIDVCIDSTDPGNLVLVEKWASMEHYEKYHHWREETGVLQQIRDLLDGPVSRRVLNVAA